MTTPIAILPASDELLERAQALALQLNVPIIKSEDADILLRVDPEGLALSLPAQPQFTPLRVDFTSGHARHRRLYGGGRGQLIAKAVGLGKLKSPMVLDVTAGLGRDAFVLATLGCQVTMIERSVVLGALLTDGLRRLQQDLDLASLSLSLVVSDAIGWLKALSIEHYPDVIYLDPMFPLRDKSAQVKKEMVMLRSVVGDDVDADQLWQLALRCAKKRVVVKRSKLAPAFEGRAPDLVFQGKSSRYDVYLTVSTL